MSKQGAAVTAESHAPSIDGLVRAAVADARLDQEAHTHLRARSGELQQGITEVIGRIATTTEYCNEEARSECTYPTEFKVKTAHEQVEILREALPNLAGCDFSRASRPLRHEADGYAVIPRYQCVDPSYDVASRIMVEKLEVALNTSFEDLKKALHKSHVSRHGRFSEGMRHVGMQQSHNDFLVIPVQLGMRHRGTSSRRAIARMRSDEFPLGIFAGAAFLLTHPDRLMTDSDLWLGCGGDVFRNVALNGENCPGSTYSFHIEKARVVCDKFWNDRVIALNGTASGWVNS